MSGDVGADMSSDLTRRRDVSGFGPIPNTSDVGAEVGDRVRWFMARAWEEGVLAGHDCVGTRAKPSCHEANPYRAATEKATDE